MFKYLRTLNNSASAPETMRVNSAYVSEDERYCKGAIFTLFEGNMQYELEEGKPLYCLLESKSAGDGKESIIAMRIMPGMIFEVESSHGSPIAVGSLVKPTYDQDGNVACITEESELAHFEVLANRVGGNENLHTVIKL